jgi:ribosome assembly protein 1
MQQWLPLSTATFQAVVDVIPAPNAAQAIRIPFMLHPEAARASSTPLQPASALEKALFACDQRPEAPLVAYVSKMFAVRRGDLPQFKPREMTAEEMRARGREERERRAAALAAKQGGESVDPNELAKPLESLNLDAPPEDKPAEDADDEVLLGFSRVFSSVLRRGATVVVTLPKYDAELGPTHPRNAKHMRNATVSDLYMMMGRDLVAVDYVPAGHVCAIAGLDNIVPRNGTLCAASANGEAPDAAGLVNLAGVNMQAAPIVRVALEPMNPCTFR